MFEELFRRAVAFHQAGSIAEAEALYRQLVSTGALKAASTVKTTNFFIRNTPL